MSEKENDKNERPKTIESDLEIEQVNDSSPFLIISGPIVTYEPRVLYPQGFDAPFSSNKDKQRDDILETCKQVNVNPPLLKAIR